MAIFPVNGHFVISSGGTWIPGAYEDERTAKYAFRFPDQVLRELQESVNPNGVITFTMLQEERRKLSIEERKR
jgi:hypothetical protein